MRKVRVRAILAALACALLAASPAIASWSVLAVDTSTGTMVVASAACVPQLRFANFPARDLMDLQAIVAPGKGIAAAQATVDNTRANHRLVFDELLKGTTPADIIQRLLVDPKIQSRQFAIVDLQGRSAGFTGAADVPVAIDRQDRVGDTIVVSVQGNGLPSADVVLEAMQAFKNASGTLADRALAAMEAADSKGGDKRCSCATEVPLVNDRDPLQGLPCDGRTALVAYILRVEATDKNGTSFNDGAYSMYISVTDQNLTKSDTGNPVKTLRRRYEEWVKVNAPK